MIKQLFVFTLLINLSSVYTEELHKKSMYQVMNHWITEDNEVLRHKELLGHKVILAMIFSSCPHACPVTIQKLQRIEDKLGPEENVRFVLASFDPVNDRPWVLKRYREKHKLDPNKWIFLSSDSDYTARQLAVALGVSYKKIGDASYTHSNQITLLDEEGIQVMQLEGLSSDTKEFVQAVSEN